MTQLALNLAGYINGVARRHAETTRQMFAAKTGLEALAILDSGRVVDIVIADSSLPGMSGPVLIAHVRTRRPGLAPHARKTVRARRILWCY
jgi:CheY-like chemotaxis protein